MGTCLHSLVNESGSPFARAISVKVSESCIRQVRLDYDKIKNGLGCQEDLLKEVFLGKRQVKKGSLPKQNQLCL